LKNQKAIQNIKSVYDPRYNAYKKAFDNNVGKVEALLQCFAAYLWGSNEQELIKKILLADAYKEADPEHKDFQDLDKESRLMRAMQGSLKADIYPSDTTDLKLS